ncbi:MAG TPA: hypothetical protein VFZ40_09520 [Pyrinomonadaceae bacterium]
MRILALDLGKYKSVACEYAPETGEHSFATIATNPKALHDLIVDREPDRVVIEICSIAGWVGARECFQRISGGKKSRRKIAVVAVGRKLLVRCWAILRNQTPWRLSAAA